MGLAYNSYVLALLFLDYLFVVLFVRLVSRFLFFFVPEAHPTIISKRLMYNITVTVNIEIFTRYIIMQDLKMHGSLM